jgi:hypothetical protein
MLTKEEESALKSPWIIAALWVASIEAASAIVMFLFPNPGILLVLSFVLVVPGGIPIVLITGPHGFEFRWIFAAACFNWLIWTILVAKYLERRRRGQHGPGPSL